MRDTFPASRPRRVVVRTPDETVRGDVPIKTDPIPCWVIVTTLVLSLVLIVPSSLREITLRVLPEIPVYVPYAMETVDGIVPVDDTMSIYGITNKPRRT
jgi:hypothetical protein